MPPWEEDNVQLVDDVGIGHVEVVLQSRYADETTKLRAPLGLSELRVGVFRRTFCSTYCCPASTALFPN
jgi:hypothetical protein